MISGKTSHIKAAEKKLGGLKFMWADFTDDKLRITAEKIIKTILPFCVNGLIRIDAIIWDVKETRHRIARKDDAKNIGRMYHDLFLETFTHRWPDGADWLLCPEERDQMDWGLLDEIQGYKSGQRGENSMFDKYAPSGTTQTKQAYEIKDIKKYSFKKSALLQAAELFAGMACYSKHEYSKFIDWMDDNDRQMTMFDMNFKDFNAVHKARFSVMKEFHELCAAGKLGVGLKSYGCFNTAEAENPVNFRWHIPEIVLDKAVTRFKLTELKNKTL